MGRDGMTNRNKLNSALDHELSDEELAALQQRLEAAPEASEEADLLRKTDELLRTTPMVAPSPTFAKRVMEAIAALPLPGFARRELNAGLALGLAAAAMLAIPVLAVVFFLLVSLLADPATFHMLLQTSIDVLTYGISLVADVAEQIRAWVTGTPLAVALLVLVVPLSVLWGWVLWLLLSGRGLAIRRTRS